MDDLRSIIHSLQILKVIVSVSQIKPVHSEGQIADKPMTIMLLEEGPSSHSILVESITVHEQDIRQLIEHQVRVSLAQT